MNYREKVKPDAAIARTMKPADDGGFEVSVKSRGKTDWRGIAALIGAASGLLGLGGSVLSMTRPDVAVADNVRITAVAKQADEANTKATEAKATADKAMLKVEVLAVSVDAQTKAIENLTVRVNAQTKEIGELIGVLKVLAK